MSLAETIRMRVDRLIDEWTCYARDHVAAAGTLDDEALRDSSRLLFTAIADDMDTLQTPGEQADKARGRRPGNSRAITTHATAHADHRVAQGFSLPDLVSEFRAARASVMRLADEPAPGPAFRIDEIERFNEAVDEALTVSIEHFDRKLNEARDMFLGVLGHDLRNPLGAVLNSARLLMRAEELSPGSLKASARIHGSARRIERMVDDLIDFTRTRLGRSLPVAPIDGDLGETAAQVVEELRGRHPHACVLYEARGDLRGRWDFARLAQVVSNLGANAIQYGDPSQPVAVRLDGLDDRVELTVRNQGPPIAPQALGRIFDPLTRGCAPGGADTGNIGLGLYICRQIALAHGGAIDVASDAGGTAFTVRIPRRPPDPPRRPG
ncbi:MAG: HAMP domain-containing sensor histidine kinase [Xylophilus ampelinus]